MDVSRIVFILRYGWVDFTTVFTFKFDLKGIILSHWAKKKLKENIPYHQFSYRRNNMPSIFIKTKIIVVKPVGYFDNCNLWNKITSTMLESCLQTYLYVAFVCAYILHEFSRI